MAETLVLANLVINADGTVTAVNQAGQAIDVLRRKVDEGEKKVKTGFDAIGLSSKRLTDGFFNMRRLITGLFAGFSVGGIVFALAQLIQSTIAATDAFKNLKNAFVDFIHSLVVNESALERTARHLKELGVTTGPELLKKMKSLREEIAKGEVMLASGTAARPLGERLLPMLMGMGMFTSKTAALSAQDMEALAKTVAQARIELAKLEQQYQQLGVVVPAVAEKFKSADFPWQGPRLDQLKELPPTIFDQIIAWNQLQQQVDKMGNPFQQIIQSQVEVLEVLDNTTSATELQIQALDQLLQKYEMWINVLGIAAGAVNAASSAGIISAQAAFRIQQALLASEAILRGMFEQARAVQAAVTPGEQWEVPFHQAAAALFFATAAFHGVGAIAGAGGGRGGGGGSSNQGIVSRPSESFTASRIPQQVTVVLDGYGMFIGEPDELARKIAEILNKAKLDNVKAA